MWGEENQKERKNRGSYHRDSDIIKGGILRDTEAWEFDKSGKYVEN